MRGRRGHEITADQIVHLHGLTIKQLASAMEPPRLRVEVSRWIHGHVPAPEDMYVAFGKLSGCGASVDLIRQVVDADAAVEQRERVKATKRRRREKAEAARRQTRQNTPDGDAHAAVK